jgi:hypothetical protein
MLQVLSLAATALQRAVQEGVRVRALRSSGEPSKL